MVKAKTKLKKEIKKINKLTLFLVCLFCLLGISAGFGVTYFLTKDDVFKINGETEITLKVGDDYIECGATAISFGKNISKNVSISGEVDTTKEGSYIIKYTIDNFRFKDYTLYRLVVVEPLGE